jgi:mevalonate kinase
MNGEHNTPLGTPVVVAPGKIPLVGEYAVLEEGSAVLAAITRHAKAQFTTRADAMSPMVSEVVKRTKAELGEVAAALPPGSVLVNTDAFQQGSEKSGFGTSAAIAVASVGAVFEALGLAIRDHKSQILAITDGARRAAQGNAGSGADLAASAYGGLIKIVRQQNFPPQVEPLAAPTGLHLVLFSAGNSVKTGRVLEGVKQYAARDPVGYEQAMDNLREIAQHFVEELTKGSATGALVAAGRYGDRLVKLTADAAVPIMTDDFTLASELARALGGIAKPTGVGGGAIGVALFATPESARLFRRACPESLACLDADLDRLGVRCQGPEETDEAGASPTPKTVHPEPVRDVVAISSRIEDAVTVKGPTAENQELAPKMAPPIIRDAHDRRAARRRVARGVVVGIAIALVLVAWIAVPNPIRARVQSAGAPLRQPAGVGLANAPSLSPPVNSAKVAAAISPPKTNDLPTSDEGRREPDAASAAPAPAPLTKQARKFAPTRDTHSASTRSPSPRAPGGTTKPFVPRAGVLSPSDF